MNNYEKAKQLESIGLPVHAGCRCGLVETVMEQYGIPIAEIIGKLDDDMIIDAVHRSLQLYGIEVERGGRMNKTAKIIREHYEMDRNPSDSEIQAEITNLNRRWVEQTLDSRCQHLKARLEVAGVNVERGNP
jgi:hypothetical protein